MAEMRNVLITGGAGFLGVNAADHLVRKGWTVTVLDNLSRAGTERNLDWLTRRHPESISFIKEDVRNADALAPHVREAGAVLHLAAQVAVTTSLVDPMTDFEVNAGGTVNVLEAVRRESVPPPVFFTSTNKVYGGMEDVQLRLRGLRYEPCDPALAHGFGESRRPDS